uniref:Uncharacterized protein n=1 Tax=Rhizophora mucronata TaxID=61149 RepID=A0A2P2R0V5_RHIMU
MSSNVTGFVSLPSTPFSTSTARGRPPGNFDPGTGSFCPLQLFAFGSFHRAPL